MNISLPVNIEHHHDDEDTVISVINHPALPQTLVACAINDTELVSLKMNTLKYEDATETAGGCMFDICLYPSESITAFFRFISEFCEMTDGAALDITIRSDSGDPTEDRKIEIHLNSADAVAGFCDIVREIQDRIAKTRSETRHVASRAA